MRNGMRPIHPGEVLREEYLLPLEISASALARELNVPHNRITEIVAEKRTVTGDTALRLARFLRTTPEFWMNLQSAYDLRRAEFESSETVLAEVTPLGRLG